MLGAWRFAFPRSGNPHSRPTGASALRVGEPIENSRRGKSGFQEWGARSVSYAARSRKRHSAIGGRELDPDLAAEHVQEHQFGFVRRLARIKADVPGKRAGQNFDLLPDDEPANGWRLGQFDKAGNL